MVLISEEQKRQILELAEESEILLDDFTAEIAEAKNHVVVFDSVDPQYRKNISYQELEKGILCNEGRFYTNDK